LRNPKRGHFTVLAERSLVNPAAW